MLRDLPTGLSERAVHPGIDSPELLAIEREANHIRQSDYEFLMSQESRDIIEKEGIIPLDYRPLQDVWRTTGSDDTAKRAAGLTDQSAPGLRCKVAFIPRPGAYNMRQVTRRYNRSRATKSL